MEHDDSCCGPDFKGAQKPMRVGKDTDCTPDYEKAMNAAINARCGAPTDDLPSDGASTFKTPLGHG